MFSLIPFHDEHICTVDTHRVILLLSLPVSFPIDLIVHLVHF